MFLTDPGTVKFCVIFSLLQLFIVDSNDLCPILPDVNYDLKPLPPLQKAPFFVAKATDGDSGVNARITYKTSDIIEAM